MRSDGPDISLENHGSIFLVRPLSAAGTDWIEQNIGEGNGYQPDYPNSIIVEHRYILSIVDGMLNDGLEIAR